MVGLWSLEDGGAALRTDGGRWSGRTNRAELEAAGRELFPHATQTFLANGLAPGAFPLAIWRDVASFSNGTLRVQFKLVAGATDQNAGIEFNLKPDGSYLYARYNTKDGNVAVWKFENGARTVLTHGAEHEQLPLNVWHTLDVQVTGTTVTSPISSFHFWPSCSNSVFALGRAVGTPLHSAGSELFT